MILDSQRYKHNTQRRGNIMSKNKPMQWEVKKLDGEKWGIFLKQEFCKTDEPVCYSASVNKSVVDFSTKRMNEDSIANFGKEE